MNITQHLRNEVVKNAAHIPLSGATAYHLLSGNLSLTNSVITAGMATTLYTGNGTTQSVVTGVDMATQWGNDVSETFGGLVWVKDRTTAYKHVLIDSVRGNGLAIYTSETTVQTAQAAQALTNTGFDLINILDNYVNKSNDTFASWNFQTTHRITGTTNHGKAYTCHYNPFTGFTIIKYEGSGLAGHEIPHHLGRKLGFVTVKNLTAIYNWGASYRENYALVMNLTDAEVSTAMFTSLNEASTILGVSTSGNASTNQYIMYGWANSYFDESNTLIGNYEVGVYQGTGAAGNKVTTRGKPAWVMIKRLDAVGDWDIFDNKRTTTSWVLRANLTTVDGDTVNGMTFLSDGFIPNWADINAAGGQYLYMVVFDNDTGSGKSKYPKATDTSALSLTATVPFANGVDANGTKNTVLTKNETVTGLTLTQGKNYVYAKNDGLYGVSAHRPRFNETDLIRSYAGESPAMYKPNENQWYNSNAGIELVANGKFDSGVTTGWSADTSGGSGTTFSVVNATMQIVRGAATGFWGSGEPYQALSLTVGTKYKIIVSIAGAAANVTLSTTLGLPSVYTSPSITNSKFEYEFIAQSTLVYLKFYPSGVSTTSNVDDVSCFEVGIVPSTPITESRNYLDAIVYADVGGQPTLVEQLPKIEYKKDLEVDTMKVLSGFDLNQKWYDVTSSRVLGATYTNTTNKHKTISVQVNIPATANSYVRAFVDNVVAGLVGNTANATSIYGYLSFEVPPFSKYVVTPTGAVVVNTWSEQY